MYSFISKLRNRSKGQALVEFALVLPLFIMLIFGIIQFGIILNAFISVTSAVREGARLAAVGASNEVVINKVVDLASPTGFVNINADSVEITNYDTLGNVTLNRTSKGEVQVAANASVEVILPILDRVVGSTFPVASSASMRVEVATAAADPGDVSPGVPTSAQVNVFECRKGTGSKSHDLEVYIQIVDNLGNPVENAFVSIRIEPAYQGASGNSGNTDNKGIKSLWFDNFYHNNGATAGTTYTVTIIEVNASGLVIESLPAAKSGTKNNNVW